MRKHKRMATNKHKRTKAKHTRRHTKKRVRFATRKMRGGETIIKYQEYPKSFSMIDKYKQKKEEKIYKKQIENICKKILGEYKEFQPNYRFLPVDKRELLKQEFVRELQKYRILLGDIDENTNEETGLYKKLNEIHRLPDDSPKKEKLLIDATNETNHYHNLIDTLRQCYEKYTDIVVQKDSAGQVVGSLNPRSKSESTGYMNINDEYVKNSFESAENNPIFRSNSSLARAKKPSLPERHSDEFTNMKARRGRSARPAEIIVSEPVVEEPPKVEEPRRRSLRRGNKKEDPVLPEYTAAIEAIADLDRFLSSERKK